MCDEWMPSLRLPLDIEQFWTLPRNPAYRYEYADGSAILTPRARHYHAVLDLTTLAPQPAPETLYLRPMRATDRAYLPGAFAWAFDGIQPFGSLGEAKRFEAAQKCLEKTWTGGDGPWVQEATFVLALEDSDRAIGALYVTLLPGGDPSAWDSFYWTGQPPPDLVLRRGGQPHLTWIFVAPVYGRHGAGTALLSASVEVLLRLGYETLWSTFMDGNVSSMLWHWRNGFRLMGHPGSRRGK